MREQSVGARRRRVPPPEWDDQLDAAVPAVASPSMDRSDRDESSDTTHEMASCFVRVSRLGNGTFDLFNRYETALWRQTAQIYFMLQSGVQR